MAGPERSAGASAAEEADHLTSFGRTARASLAAMTVGTLVLILIGVLLIWFGVAGYKDWDASQRAIAGTLGLLDAVGFCLLLALLLRQQIAGAPRVRSTPPGLVVGSTPTPWAETDEFGPASLFALPHVGIRQLSTAPKRLTGLRSIQYMPMGDRRILFLAARQVGTDLEADIQRLRDDWSRGRSNPEAV